MRVAGLVLAAGASTRAGFAKGLARLGRRTLLSIAIGTLRRGGCRDVTVVVGGPYRAALHRIATSNRARVVVNQAPERGMFSSLQLGLRAITGRPPVAISLVDHPHVRAATVATLIARVTTGARPRPSAAIPTFGRKPGHPYVVAHDLAWALATSRETSNAQKVIARARGIRRIPVGDAAVLEDLDTARKLKASGVKPPHRS